MIEITLLTYLKTVLGEPVYMEIPGNKPNEFFILERMSGGEENFIKSSSFVVQSYAKTLYRAAEMCEEAITAMKNAETLDEIVSTSLNSHYNFTDPETKQYRYQALFDIQHY